MKPTLIIKKFVRWNGICEGGEVLGKYIWDNQFDDVLKDYKKTHKVIIVEVKK